MNRKRIVIILISTLILVLLGYIAYHFMNSPASGSVTTTDANLQQTPSTFDLTPVHISGAYGSFDVPKAMQQRTTDRPSAPTLADYRFTYQDTTSWVLAVTVTDVANTAQGQSSSYQLRASLPNQYHESPETVNGKQYKVMTDVSANGFSKVAYQTQGGREVQISLTGNSANGTQNLQKTFDMVLGSWTW